MFLLAVFLDLGVDPLHQCISLHQHVGESRTGEDSDHLNEIGSEWQLGELEEKNEIENIQKICPLLYLRSFVVRLYLL